MSRNPFNMKKYPLLQSQVGVLAECIKYPQMTAYNMPYISKLPDNTDMNRLKSAWEKLMDARPVLKNRYEVSDSGEILQYSDPDMMIPVIFRGMKETELKSYIDHGFIRPFELFSGQPLVRVELIATEEGKYQLVDMHHTICDGLTMLDLINKRDIPALYEGKTLSPEEHTIYEAAEREQESFTSEEYTKAKEYYTELFAESEFATLSTKPVVDPSPMIRVVGFVETKSIDDWCSAHQVKTHHLFRAAFVYTFAMLTRQRKVGYYSSHAGRARDMMNAYGMFVKSVPKLTAVDNEKSVIDYIKSMRENTGIDPEIYPFTHFCSDLQKVPRISFNYMGIDTFSEYAVLGEEKFKSGVSVRGDTNVDLSVHVYLKDSRYEIRLESSGAINDMDTLWMVERALKTVLTGMMDHPDRKIGEISLIDQDELAAIIELSAGEKLPYDESKIWLDLFEESVKEYPDHTAVMDGVSAITYSEIERCSDLLSDYLIGKGIELEDFVGIKLPRSKEFIAAIIGIHKAGAAYVPIDPEYPKDRVEYMLSDSGAKILIESLAFEGNSVIVNGERSDIGEGIRKADAGPDNLAYMIYTSGSTGKPKGAMLTHRGLMNFTVATRAQNELTEKDRVASHRSFSFDAHIEDVFPVLSAGAGIYIMPDEIRKDLDAMGEFIEHHKITGCGFTTSVAKLMLSNQNLYVRYMTVGGEPLVNVGSDKIQIINEYGPTECTNDSCVYKLDKGRLYQTVPIGRPMPNSYCFIVDINGHLLPKGAAGELCYAGPQTGRGYWKLDEKTGEVFGECPYVEGIRMYHTGDLAKWNEEDLLVCLGRIDQQVKLRGYRIEIEEIEANALKIEGVKEAAAAVREVNGSKSLVLYYAPEKGQEISEQTVRTSLEESPLAVYMHPDIYMGLDRMPKLPNGKIDRKNLPQPAISRTTEYAAPETDAEAAVADVMMAILGLDDKVGRDDNFFDLGGVSIKAIRMVSALRGQGYKLSVPDIMKLQTVSKMAEAAADIDNSASVRRAFSGNVGISPIFRYFLDCDYKKASHFNQANLYQFADRADADAIQAAWNAVVSHHDMLRAVYRAGTVEVLREDTGMDIEITDMTESDRFKEDVEKACVDVQENMELDKALVRIVLFRGKEGDYLLICAHHFAIDGVSWRIIHEDLESAYTQVLEKKDQIVLPARTDSYKDYVDAMERFAESYTLSLEEPYWDKIDKKLLNCKNRDMRERKSGYGHLVVSLDRADTKDVFSARLASLGLEINDLLLTSVCEAYHEISGDTGISVQMEGHGREEIDAELLTDRTVGWFTSVYPVVFENIGGNLKDDIITVKETIHRIPEKGVGYLALRRNQPDRKVPWISYNYLGEMDAENGSNKKILQQTEISSGPIWAEENYEGPALMMNSYIQKGEFSLILDYDTDTYSGDDAKAFADAILRYMKEGAGYLNKADDMTTASDLGETEWSNEEFHAVCEDYAKRGVKIQRILPLSGMQEAMLLKHMSEPDSPAYRLVFVYKMDLVPSEEMLRHALDRLALKHEMLRSAIVYHGVGEYRQVITDRMPSLSVVDLSHADSPETMVLDMREELLKNAFDLQYKPLFGMVLAKVSKDKCYLITVSHHIIQDGWSMRIYMDDFVCLLAKEMGRPASECKCAEDGTYESAVRELIGKDRRNAKKYWQDLLLEYDTYAKIPSYHTVPKDRQIKDELSVKIDAVSTKEFANLCRDSRATLSNGIELAWGLVLSTYMRSKDVVFGKVVSGRDNTRVDVSRVVGLFINTVPVRVKLDDQVTVREELMKLQDQAVRTGNYDYLALSEIMDVSELGTDLLSTVIAFENYSSGFDDESSKDNTVKLTPYCMKEEIFDDINPVAMIDEEGCLVLHIGFRPDKYEVSEIENVLKLFKNFVVGMTSYPDMPVKNLPRLSKEDRKAVAELSRGRQLDYDRSKTFIDLFVDMADQYPDHTAVVDEFGSYTYSELDRLSDLLAGRLMDEGIRGNEFIAVKMGRVKEFTAAVIAVMKAGAAYVPVDPSYPEDRIQYMLEDSEAGITITEDYVRETASKDHGQVKRVNHTAGDHIAYMIYTSGSTGKPKGVMIPHRALAAFLAWRKELVGLDEKSIHAQHASFSFDASLDDLICPLAFGGQVHILSDDIRKNLPDMNRYFADNGVKGLTLSTQMGMALLEQYPDMNLEFLMMGGEKMLPGKKTDVRIINGYGPTEFTVCSSYHVVDQSVDRDIPIGRAVPNTWSFVCDEYGHLLPQGVAGELCLMGEQLSLGYWKRSDLTDEKFLRLPEIDQSVKNASRVYRTGDIVRYNMEGELEYLGRADDQVKLRGFRIEMGEIESVAAEFDGIGAVSTKVVKVNGTQVLCLYYTAESAIDQEVLKKHMAASLAEYMVPSVYMCLEEMPLTPNGKVNKKALPVPALTSSQEYVPPADETEQKVAEAMQRTLKLSQPVGALDNFFELGGDSIKAIRMTAGLRQEGITLQVWDVMKHKTVRAMAANAALEAGTADLSQESIAGEVKDSPIIRFFHDLRLPNPSYFHQSNLFRLREKVTGTEVGEMIKGLYRQHDMLRAVLTEDGRMNIREYDDAEKILVPEADLQDASDYREKISEACKEIKNTFDTGESLFRYCLFHTPEGDMLFMAAHHLIVDGISWRILTGDMETLMSGIRKGEPSPELPAKTSTYRDYAEKVLTYADSNTLKSEIPYWKNVEKSMQRMEGSAGKNYSRIFNTGKYELDVQKTETVLKARIGRFGADRNDYLISALAESYASVFGKNEFSLQLEGHGRERISDELVTDRTVGWFTSVFPVVIKNITGDIDHDIINVKETMKRIPNKGAGYNILRYLSDEAEFEKERWAGIGFNYLGEMDSESDEDSFFQAETSIDTGSDIDEENLFGPDLMINCLVRNHIFEADVQYNSDKYDDTDIHTFVNRFFGALIRIAGHLESMENDVITASDLGEYEWSEEEFKKIMDDFAGRGEKISRIYPLTSMQEGLLLKYLAEPENWAYRLVTIFRMNILPSKSQLENAVNRVMEKYEVLRSAILYDGVNSYRQAITDRKACVNMMDISSEKDHERAILKIREDILTNAFDLQKKPLLSLTCARISDDESFLVVSIHHIIVDGWCIPLYLGDFRLFLEEELTGRKCTSDELPGKGVYEAAVREMNKKDLKEALEYWSKLLDGYETPARIMSFGVEPGEYSVEDTSEIRIDKEITDQLMSLTKKEKVTMGNAVELAWGLVHAVTSGSDDVVFAKVVSGRDSMNVDVSQVVGLFINSIPVRLRFGREDTLLEALKALQDQAAESNRYDDCPINEIVKLSPLGDQLYQSVFAYENYESGADADSGSLSFDMKLFYGKEENIDTLTPSVSMDADGRLCMKIVFDRTSYRKEEMDRVVKLFAKFVKEIAENPEVKIADIKKLDKEEEEEIIQLSKGETIEYDEEEIWLDMYKRHVLADPSAIAVVDADGSITYSGLDEASDKIAASLAEAGIRPDDFVAIKMRRRKEFIMAIVGIHKAGAAYVPVDLDYPEQRVSYMLEDCGAKCVLTEDVVKDIMKGGKLAFCGDVSTNPTENMPASKPERYAYMIYTSGSTGKPKGAILTQRGLMNFTVATALQNELKPSDRVASHRSFSFDAHIEDVFPVLASGASIHIMHEEIRKDPGEMAEFLEEHQITGCGFTTSVAKMLLSEYELKVRYVTVGGEALSGVVSSDVQIINEYGPTECTNDICVHKLKRGKEYKIVPIGRPIANSYCFIVDQHGHLLPKGMAGELCYAGPQTGKGYWNKEEMTKEKFVECPFVKGLTMYRTGDLARYNEEGLIECLGRIDAQVKLRGFRIELGEIEDAAGSCDGVKFAAAAVKEVGNAPHLILYYSQKEGKIVTEHVIKSVLENSSLTDYMHPEIYVCLESMPLLPNGKIDRKSLPEVQADFSVENVRPDNAIEEHFLRAAYEAIGVDGFGVTDDLFAMGMTSLSAMKLVAKINAMDFYQKYRVADVMRYRTIRAMINGNRRIYWQYEAYDPEKPYIVFMYGIAPVAKTLQMLKVWGEHFNIFVIESIDSHYDILFDERSDFEDVVDMYDLMVSRNIPEEARIAGFIGFSWGGTLSYRLAERISEVSGTKPFVVMGDSYFINQTEGGRQEKLTPESFPENLFELTGGAITQREVITKMNISITLDNTVTRIPAYDGNVVLLNALGHYDKDRKKANIDLIKSLAKNLEIIDFPDHTHDDLFFDQNQVPYYLQIMLSLLERQ